MRTEPSTSSKFIPTLVQHFVIIVDHCCMVFLTRDFSAQVDFSSGCSERISPCINRIQEHKDNFWDILYNTH